MAPSTTAARHFVRPLLPVLRRSCSDLNLSLIHIYVGNDKWALSPAFDLNPFPDKLRESKTWLSEDTGPIDSIGQLLGKAAYFYLCLLYTSCADIGVRAGIEQLLLRDPISLKHRKPTGIDLHMANVVGAIAIPADGARSSRRFDSRYRPEKRHRKTESGRRLIEASSTTRDGE